MTAISLSLEPLARELTHEQFYELCMANQGVAMENSPQGELIIMPPIGSESGSKEAGYIADLVFWNRQGGPTTYPS